MFQPDERTVPTPENDRPLERAPFANQTVVFTGKLASLGRREAHALVERLGGVVTAEITARTTMLVVGAEGLRAPRRPVAGRPAPAANGPSPGAGGPSSGSGRAAPAANGPTSGAGGPTSGPGGPSPGAGGPSAAKTRLLRQAEALNERTPGQVAIVSEGEFCRLGGLQSSETLRRRYHSLRRIRERYPLLRDDRIRQLRTWGLIRPIVRTNADAYYGFADVAVVKRIHGDLERGRSFRAAVRSVLAARDGQLALDFSAVRGEARPAKVLALARRAAPGGGPVPPHRQRWEPSRAQAARAARYFLEGSALDEGSAADPERAAEAYHKALTLDPNLVPALVNLANVHYARDRFVEAQALYERALGLEPGCFEACFNLGNIHHDLERYAAALACYREALRLQPSYADAHFYLAVTLEKMGHAGDAKAHWRAYGQLAPEGEWIDLAREYSE